MKAAGRHAVSHAAKKTNKADGHAPAATAAANIASYRKDPRLVSERQWAKRRIETEIRHTQSSELVADEDVEDNLHNLDFLLGATYEHHKRQKRSATRGLEATTEMTFVRLYQSNAELFKRWMLLLSRGISGQTKVLLYNLESLVRYGGFITMHLEGTLATMDKAQSIFFCGLVFFFTLVFIGVTSLTNSGHDMETEALEEITNNLSKFVPFVLGMYLALSLNRWWTIRTQGLSEVLHAACNVVMVVSCVLPTQRHRSVRVLVMKWSFASVFLLVKAVRDQPSLNDMLFKGLLNDEEVGILQDVPDLYGRPSVVWGWVLRIVNESFAEANGPMPYSIQVTKVCELVLQASNGLSCIDNHLSTQLPFVYVHLIALLVDINSFFLVVKTSVASAVAYASSDWQRLISEIVCCLVVPMLYRGLLSISYAVYDPFGDDVLDFPIGSYMEWNAQCCHALFQAQERFPGIPGDVFSVERQAIKKTLVSDAARVSKADRVRETKKKFRRILIMSRRNGKLEEEVRKIHEINREQHEVDRLTASMNVGKISAGMKAAATAADPLASEIKNFCHYFRTELIYLQQDVVMLRDAIETDGSKQHENFERVCSNLFTDWGVYG